MIHLLLATRNTHKKRELIEMLGADFRLEDLRVHPQIGEVIEDGATFLENATLKAVTTSRQVTGLVLADDSGLEVDSLGGRPGVYSARFAGPGATDFSNRRKLLAELARLGTEGNRRARFRCVLVLAERGNVVASFAGAAEGEIVERERGENGFGYDALFQPDGFLKTFAELAAREKNALSHRAAAVAQLRVYFQARRDLG